MSNEKEVKFVASSADQVERIANFLKPFADANQILSRSREELLILIQNGCMAMIGDELVGFAAVEIYSRKLAEVQCLTVSSAHRGMGIGQGLVDHCVEVARRQGVFEVMAITSTEGLFRRCGFDYSLPQQKRAMFIQTSETRMDPE